MLFIVIDNDRDGSVVWNMCNNRITVRIATGHSSLAMVKMGTSKSKVIIKWITWKLRFDKMKACGITACTTNNIVRSSSSVVIQREEVFFYKKMHLTINTSFTYPTPKFCCYFLLQNNFLFGLAQRITLLNKQGHPMYLWYTLFIPTEW